MKGRETKGPPSADLLVCFPSRAHLTLMPKPICSPARPSEPNKRLHRNHRHLRKPSIGGGGGQGRGSPLLWAKTKQMGSDISEPTSPKVNCAGQIKVRHKASAACKSWQSVMEEIERIHNDRKLKKRSKWIESFGFKKEVMQFLTCLRSIKFDFRCFGSIPRSEITSDDDDEDDGEEDDEYQRNKGSEEGGEGSRTVFSKWFMVLQENQNVPKFCKEKERSLSDESLAVAAPSVPPPNALLLMRCRSAPAKSWLEEKEEEQEEEQEDEDNEEEEEEEKKEEEKKGKNLKALMEEERRTKKKESLVVTRYDPDLYKISSDIAKETWVVGGIRDPLSRSRSWKR